MIEISGSVQRAFIFPAARPIAFAYYADMQRTLNMLPHISVVHRYAPNQYRMMYATTELGVYRVRMLCDLIGRADEEQYELCFDPLDDVPPADSEAGLYSLTGQGYYSSRSLFFDEGEQTRIEYRLTLRSTLPIPLGLRFMPVRVVDGIARNITRWRIHETAGGFIDHSIQKFLREQGRSQALSAEPS